MNIINSVIIHFLQNIEKSNNKVFHFHLGMTNAYKLSTIQNIKRLFSIYYRLDIAPGFL